MEISGLPVFLVLEWSTLAVTNTINSDLGETIVYSASYTLKFQFYSHTPEKHTTLCIHTLHIYLNWAVYDAKIIFIHCFSWQSALKCPMDTERYTPNFMKHIVHPKHTLTKLQSDFQHKTQTVINLFSTFATIHNLYPTSMKHFVCHLFHTFYSSATSTLC